MHRTYHVHITTFPRASILFFSCTFIKSIEGWVYSSLPFLSSGTHSSPNWLLALHVLGGREGHRVVWEGGGHMVWLIFAALRHHSPKPHFLEGCSILPAPLWVAPQCPWGQAWRIPCSADPLASFALLENVARLVLKRIL